MIGSWLIAKLYEHLLTLKPEEIAVWRAEAFDE